jgi:hypothetical protein
MTRRGGVRPPIRPLTSGNSTRCAGGSVCVTGAPQVLDIHQVRPIAGGHPMVEVAAKHASHGPVSWPRDPPVRIRQRRQDRHVALPGFRRALLRRPERDGPDDEQPVQPGRATRPGLPPAGTRRRHRRQAAPAARPCGPRPEQPAARGPLAQAVSGRSFAPGGVRRLATARSWFPARHGRPGRTARGGGMGPRDSSSPAWRAP